MKQSWTVVLQAIVVGASAFTFFSSAVNAQELLRHEGKFIRLATDAATPEESERLAAAFDTAVPQWLAYYGLKASQIGDWKVDAHVIENKSLFLRNGLLPAEVPDFPFGYALGRRVWVLKQQSEYYTTHLLLHEGVHSLMFEVFGGAGPTWFMEGTAELLATHDGIGEETKINFVPQSRDQVPYWGRFKVLDQLRNQSELPALEAVMRYQPNLLGQVDAYSCSWAAVMLLDRYPEYRKALVAAAVRGRETGPEFNRGLHRELRASWPVVVARWRLMLGDLDYGFDWQRHRVELSTQDPEWNGETLQLEIDAERGWQSVGVRFRPGTKLTIKASGEVAIASDPESNQPWMSQPQGVTIVYHRGKPLGQLQACVLPNASGGNQKLAPLDIRPVERESEVEFKSYAWLLLRVNDSVNRRDDNKGNYQVSIQH